jgi:ATP-dependent DNA helicase
MITCGAAAVPWGLLVVDESHRLKQSTSKLKADLETYCWTGELGGTQKIILTGTPLQNDLMELWSLCHFVMPLIFADREAFGAVYGFLQLGTEEGRDDLVSKQERDHIISTLHRLLERYLLRRTKAEADVSLPPKVEVVVYCGMTEVQEQLARALCAGRLAEEVAAMGWFLTPGDSAMARLGKGGGGLSNLQMHLRKVVNHPYLFAEPHPPPEDNDPTRKRFQHVALPTSTVEARASREELLEVLGSSDTDEESLPSSSRRRMGRKRPNLRSHVRPRTAKGGSETDETIVECCAKMQVLDRMLRQLKRQGHKVLIFSQFARTLEILSDYMELRADEFGKYEHLDGSTPREERQESMDRFNRDASTFVFLLSTRAGGMGINLTGADTVIMYDSDWNPHADSQAEDRAHRIGQTRPVVVYRLVTAGSVEEALVHRANSKRALERIVLQDGKWLREEAKRGRAPSRERSAKRVARASMVSPDCPTPAPADLSREDMRRWLRDDVDSLQASAPITAEELEGVLDRRAVLSAGATVLATIEGEEAAQKLGFPLEQLRAAAESAKGTASLPPKGRGYEVTYHSVGALKSIARFAWAESE